MRFLSLLAGLLACAPAMAQSLPPRIQPPTDPTHAVNLAYLNSALAAAAANAANATNLTSGVLPAARLPLATPSTPGGIKCGPGLVCGTDGTAAVDSAVATAVTTVPTLPNIRLVQSDGTYVTGTQFATKLAGTGLVAASDGTLSVDSQVPAAASAPALADLKVLQPDGTYLTGQQLKTILGVP